MTLTLARQVLLAASLALVAVGPASSRAFAQAQDDNTFAKSGSMRIQAVVTRIERAERVVTVKLPNGNLHAITAGPEVQNFDRIAVGDTLDIQATASAVVDLVRPDANTPLFQREDMAAKAAPGEKPAGVVAQKVTAVVKITSIDAQAGTVTFVGPLGNAYTVSRPDAGFKESLKDFRVGDLVQASYMEILSIAVAGKK